MKRNAAFYIAHPASAGVVLLWGLLFSTNALADAALNGSSAGDPALSISSGPHTHSEAILNGSAWGDPALSTASGQPDPALCRALVKHTPAPDVAYQPGVDGHGKPVTPADVPGQAQIKMPDKIQIPVTISLARALNLSTSQYPFSQLGAGTESSIGTFTVEGDRVSFNGQPLTDDQQDNLAVLCMKPR